MNLRPGVVCLLLIALSLAGCVGSQCQSKAYQDEKSADGPLISHDTVYYEAGPQQAAPPDGTFEAGTPVEIIQEAGSYILVRAEDGRQGYVVSDAISMPVESH